MGWRRIRGFGAWGDVVGKRASTPLYEGIKISDAIKHVLEAIGVPVGKIDDTPEAILDYWWMTDQQDAEKVLLGLAEMGGIDARLDDYDGKISFSSGSLGSRLNIYGGTPSAINDNAPGALSSDTWEGVGANELTDGPGGNRRYIAFGLSQIGIERKSNGAWFAQPFSHFLDVDPHGRRFVVECVDSFVDGSDYKARLVISRADGNEPFISSTLTGTKSFRCLVGGGEQGNLIAGLVGGTGSGNWAFDRAVTVGGQRKGHYVMSITEALALAPEEDIFAAKQGSPSQANSTFPIIRPPAEYQRLTFQSYQRDNEDSRYYNTVRVGTVTRVLQPISDVWTSPEDIQIAANASLTVALSGPQDTPFKELTVPVVGTDYTVASGSLSTTPVLSNVSGSTANLTLTAGSAGARLQNLKVRGRLLLPGIQSAFINQDEAAVAQDGEIAWKSAGIIPTDIRKAWLDTWAQGKLLKGLERGWVATFKFLASPDSRAGRDQWSTLMRLRPGRLVNITHSRGAWLGVVRQVERTSGADVDHVDRYKVTCELTNIDEARGNLLRVGLSSYGNDQVLA